MVGRESPSWIDSAAGGTDVRIRRARLSLVLLKRRRFNEKYGTCDLNVRYAFADRTDPPRLLMCRVADDGPPRCERLALGPSSESLQGRNPREVGHGAAARTMGISRGRSKMSVSMKCVMERR